MGLDVWAPGPEFLLAGETPKPGGVRIQVLAPPHRFQPRPEADPRTGRQVSLISRGNGPYKVMVTGDFSVKSILVSGATLTCCPRVLACTAVPAPAPIAAPMAAPLPWPAMAPISAPSPAPPPMVSAVRVPRDAPRCSYRLLSTL